MKTTTRKNPVATNRQHAFTLIELMVVMSIILLLSELILPVVKSAITRGQMTRLNDETFHPYRTAHPVLRP